MTTVLESPEHSAISQAPTDMITCYLAQEAVGKCSLVASLENQWQAPILSAYHQWLGFLPRCLPRAHRSPPPHHKTKQAAANRSSLVFNIETASQVTLGVKNPLAIRDSGSIPGLGRFPGAGCGNPLQYSCLENPVDGGGWRPHTSSGPSSLWQVVERLHVSDSPPSSGETIQNKPKTHTKSVTTPFSAEFPCRVFRGRQLT